ncbi:hypothetical protein TNCV_717551 [Trichonephila clavipes]|nr:hypothetical protein TNCV_717551 [Trichonephila clavipes]
MVELARNNFSAPVNQKKKEVNKPDKFPYAATLASTHDRNGTGYSRWIGLNMSPLSVRNFTSLIIPSFPGKSSSTLPSSQCSRFLSSVPINTMSPSFILSSLLITEERRKPRYSFKSLF